ncbi:MAG: glycine oxidase ThiO [Cyanobacteria bacterium J06635_15]
MTGSRDVLIIGGGIIGLAIAVELQQRGAQVTVLSRDFEQAASRAAAGMLAPQAEGITPGEFQALCLCSLAEYPTWTSKLENLTGESTGYWPCGVLAPYYTPENSSPSPSPNGSLAHSEPLDLSPPTAHSTVRYWFDRTALQHYQPGLGEAVTGAWWFPEEGQVDNRALFKALRLAAQTLGVDLQAGITVDALQQRDRQITHVRTSAGDFEAGHYVLAAGSWSNELLPVPVVPCKGQMAAVKLSPGDSRASSLQRVLFGPDIYIVPRQDGRILIGATVEDVGFTPHNTPAGLQQLFERAARLYPDIQTLPLHECWWGFRPATPDQMPILGPSHCTNLTLATGHYRNGILLAPVTASVISQWIVDYQADPLLDAFSWERFQSPISPVSQSFSAAVVTPPSPSPVVPMQVLESISTPQTPSAAADQPLTIAGRKFESRLMTGTGKYDNFDVMRQAVAASGSQIVTVAVRRVQTNAPGHEGLAEALDWTKIWMLPNTAGCQTADDAVRVARLGREMAKLLGQEDNNFIKLEVIPDAKYLLPDPIGTLQAAEQLAKEGFAVLPYINADPLLAKRLEEVGCVTVMPLGSPIGSGQGIRNAANIQIIIENAKVPVVVDAGIGSPSEAAQAMEMGADALLINTAIAKAKDPIGMGRAMGLAAEAGRLAYMAGRIPTKAYASASSPLTGVINS